MDKLDQLLALYTGRCVDDEAEYFLSVDVSGIEYNEEIKKRMLRYAFKRSRYERKRYAVKVILVACLVAMSVVFTACVSIPKIREAIWDAVIEWYDDYISVKFEEITDQDTTTSGATETDDSETSTMLADEITTSTNAEATIIPPKTIEQKAYIASLPEGYYAEDGGKSTLFILTNFFDATGTFKFCLTQDVLSTQQSQLDTEGNEFIETSINGFPAVLLEDSNYRGVYSLMWTDGWYSYTIYGMFDSLSELVNIAESISLLE